MEQTVNERLGIFIQSLGISKVDFARRINITRQQLDNWINLGVKIPIISLTKIAIEYPELNMRWLLCGQAEMTFTINTSSEGNTLPDNHLNSQRIKILYQSQAIKDNIENTLTSLKQLHEEYMKLLAFELREEKKNPEEIAVTINNYLVNAI